jgi:hypothetical protein
MPIHYAPPPKNGTTLVQEGLTRLSGRTSPLSQRAVDFNSLQIGQPHAIYDLRADQVAGGGGLSAANATGFRYLVTGGGANLAAAEVQADKAGTATLLANINYGPFVDATAQAWTQAAKLGPVSAGSYEGRVLRFSAIGLMALWLKSDSGGGDLIVPIAPAPAGLEAGKAYSEADFLKTIKPLAQQRADNKDPARVP